MRQRIIPPLAPVTRRQRNGGGCYETKASGLAVLNSPLLNKGTAFTAEERKALGLARLLPRISARWHDLRSVSLTMAVAVAEAADAERLARVTFGDSVQQVQDAMWEPEYRRIRAS